VQPHIPFSAADLKRAARVPFRGGPLTRAGRALQKHRPSDRPSSPYPEPSGNPQQVNRQAQQIIDEILDDPASTFSIATRMFHGQPVQYIQIQPPSPDRRLVRFDINGNFLTFLET